MSERSRRERPAIRPVRPDDHAAILALWQAADLPTEPDGRDSRDAFLAQLARSPGLYLVAEEGGEVAGVVLGTHDGRKGWINRLAVHPRGRRRGTAAALIEAVEHRLREEGIHIVAALVERTNKASYEFFRSVDYVDDVPVHYLRKLFREGVERH